MTSLLWHWIENSDVTTTTTTTTKTAATTTTKLKSDICKINNLQKQGIYKKLE
jgi:hypothetical protein